MMSVSGDFISGLADVKAWPSDARTNLLDMVMDCGMDLEQVQHMIRAKALLHTPGAGPSAHAGLIKCAMKAGCKYSIEFWHEQLWLLGDDYGALIFGGLLEHGLDEAVRNLPFCCASDTAVSQMALLIPALVDKFGVSAVETAFRGPLALLGAEAHEAVLDALREEGVEVAPMAFAARESDMWGQIEDLKLLRGDRAKHKALEKMST
jgi:hypothetical protein